MPFIHVSTNVSVSAECAEEIKTGLGSAIKLIPGKTEQWLMAEIEGDKTLYFQGDSRPAAIVQVSLYGEAPESALSTLTLKLTMLLTASLAVPSDRIYISYQTTPYWGWNGSNF